MQAIELVLALLVVVAALAPVARRLRMPPPILLVLVGLLLALLPIGPDVTLSPDVVFLLFLPPLIYVAAFDTSIRDVRASVGGILSLAVGLVLATTAVVAVLVHALVPDLSWAAACAFGAIVSPPDPVAATAILRQLGVPRRLVTVLEGEGLFNDATALVVYQAALAAAATAFSVSAIGLRFVAVGAGGAAVGLVVGLLIVWLRRQVDDPSVEITISLLTPFAAYLPAEQLGVSGVLATITAGLCAGWWAPQIMHPETRLRGRAVWDMVVFILDGLVFILIGLQLRTARSVLAERSVLPLLGLGVLVCLAVILVRFAWVVPAGYWERWRSRRSHARDPAPPWPEVVVMGWAGMRGVVSLAAALALPLTTPERPLLIFLTFCVILATLVGQGLSLPWLVQRLRVREGDATQRQEVRARTVAVEAATTRIRQLAEEWPTHLPLIESMRAQYDHRATHLTEPSPAGSDGALPADPAAQQELVEHQRIRRAVIDAQRAAVLDLRTRGEINDEVWRRVERDLDLEELRMEA